MLLNIEGNMASNMDSYDLYSDKILTWLEYKCEKSFRLDEYVRRRIHDLFWAGYTSMEAAEIISRALGYTL